MVENNKHSDKYKSLPDGVIGTFKVYVYNVLYRQREKDEQKVIWQLEIEDENQYKGMTFPKFSNYGTEKGFKRVRDDLNFLGIRIAHVEDIDNIIPDIVGRKLEVEITEVEVDGKTYRSVKIVKAFPAENLTRHTSTSLEDELFKGTKPDGNDGIKEVAALLRQILVVLTALTNRQPPNTSLVES